jgi:hypothetical protein
MRPGIAYPNLRLCFLIIFFKHLHFLHPHFLHVHFLDLDFLRDPDFFLWSFLDIYYNKHIIYLWMASELF